MQVTHKNKPWIFSGDVSGEIVSPGLKRTVMAFCDELMCVKFEFEEGAVGALHSHPHTQVCYVISGRYRFTMGDETKEISQGDSLYIKSGIEHGCVCLSKGTVIDYFTPMREDFIK